MVITASRGSSEPPSRNRKLWVSGPRPTPQPIQKAVPFRGACAGCRSFASSTTGGHTSSPASKAPATQAPRTSAPNTSASKGSRNSPCTKPRATAPAKTRTKAPPQLLMRPL